MAKLRGSMVIAVDSVYDTLEVALLLDDKQLRSAIKGLIESNKKKRLVRENSNKPVKSKKHG